MSDETLAEKGKKFFDNIDRDLSTISESEIFVEAFKMVDMEFFMAFLMEDLLKSRSAILLEDMTTNKEKEAFAKQEILKLETESQKYLKQAQSGSDELHSIRSLLSSQITGIYSILDKIVSDEEGEGISKIKVIKNEIHNIIAMPRLHDSEYWNKNTQKEKEEIIQKCVNTLNNSLLLFDIDQSKNSKPTTETTDLFNFLNLPEKAGIFYAQPRDAILTDKNTFEVGPEKSSITPYGMSMNIGHNLKLPKEAPELSSIHLLQTFKETDMKENSISMNDQQKAKFKFFGDFKKKLEHFLDKDIQKEIMKNIAEKDKDNFSQLFWENLENLNTQISEIKSKDFFDGGDTEYKLLDNTKDIAELLKNSLFYLTGKNIPIITIEKQIRYDALRAISPN